MSKMKPYSWREFINLILKSKLPWGLYLLGIIAALASVTLTLGLPLVTQKIMEGQIFDNELISKYVWLSIASTILVSVSAFFGYITGPIAKRNIQKGIWPKLIRMPMRRYEEHNARNLISRVTMDPGHVNAAVNDFSTVLTATYSLVGSYAIMYSMNPKLTFALMPVIPYILIVSAVVGHFTQKTQYGVQEKLSVMTAFFAERLPKIRLIKTFGKEDEEVLRADAAIREQYEADKKRAFVDLFAEPLMQSIRALVVGITLIYGGILVGRGELKVSEVIAFYLYVQFIHNNVMKYGLFWQTIKQAKGAASKIADISNSEDEQLTRSRSFESVVTESPGDITLENVSFSYSGRNVLSNVNVTFPEGKVTALIGPSGSGKTTIFNLVERMYEPNVGRLLLGGMPTAAIHLDDWRRSIVMVGQSARLLSGTIRDNILYGADREVTEEELWIAAELAAAAEFIREFPEGLDKEVGEFGSKLSGGQRQRIAIARAFILNPDYLLLDEATASLDSECEHLINRALKQLMRGRTTIMISHDMRNIRNADQIVILDGGRVTGSGTHEELLASNELYGDLIGIQEEKSNQLAVPVT